MSPRMLTLAAAAAAAGLACEDATGPAGPPVVIAVVAGNGFSCALDTEGVVYCWGENTEGQLGRGTLEETGAVGPVTGGLSFSAIAAGDDSACGLADGRPHCWGAGTVMDADGPLLSPTAVDPADLSFTAITVGGRHACALTSAGAALCWGTNSALGGGQLGNGTVTSSAVATPVSGGLTFEALAAGFAHTCGVAAGDAWCWGSNFGQALGPTDVSAVAEPLAVGVDVTPTSSHAGAGLSCVQASSGIHCWGINTAGQLGRAEVGGPDPQAEPVDTPTPLSGLATGPVNRIISHACALAADGEAHCWGANDHDQLGRTTETTCGLGTDDFACGPSPGAVETALRFDQIDVGADHTCAVADGVAYCWGANDHGQLGVDGAGSVTPVEVVIEVAEEA